MKKQTLGSAQCCKNSKTVHELKKNTLILASEENNADSLNCTFFEFEPAVVRVYIFDLCLSLFTLRIFYTYQLV